MTATHAAEFERVIGAGGIVLFPSDTVYGLAVDPDNEDAIARLYALKGRASGKPAARMFFDLQTAVDSLAQLEQLPRTRAALSALLPGAVTVVLPGGIGLRVVEVPELAGVSIPVLQTSANRSGEPEARALEQVDAVIRAGVDLEIDGGTLPGVASTVLDLSAYEDEGRWETLRAGAVTPAAITAVLGAP